MPILAEKLLSAAAFALAGTLLGWLVAAVAYRIVVQVTRRTSTELDDIVALNLRLPVASTLAGLGVWYGTRGLGLSPEAFYLVTGGTMTLVVLFWTVATNRIAGALLLWMEEHGDSTSVITARTRPVYDIASRAVVWGGTLYFLFLAWSIDLTGWLASAGVLGIAVGFAAKDTLSNLVAGAFILMDAPYKLGDYLVLATGHRGRVTEIGIRTTRMLTRDDVEIIVPNATMSNSVIINESGGPHEKYRIRLDVGVSYDSDLDQVREVLVQLAKGDGVALVPAPRVRVRAFADSSVHVQLLLWVHRPELRGRVSDRVMVDIHKSFRDAGIDIPFPIRDLRFSGPTPSSADGFHQSSAHPTLDGSAPPS